MALLHDDWFLNRLWEFLAWPSDIQCRSASVAWAHTSSCADDATEKGKQGSSTSACRRYASAPPPKCRRRRLRIFHVVVPGRANAFLNWLVWNVDVLEFQSLSLPLRIPESLKARPESDNDDDMSSASSSASVGSRASRQGIARKLRWLTSRIVSAGAANWVAWLMDSRAKVVTSGHDASSSRYLCMESHRCGSPVEHDKIHAMFREAVVSSPLRGAASAGHAEVVRLLLDARAGIHLADENDCTALHWAADKGHSEVCQVLLEKRADPDVRDDDDWTPLCLAADEGHIAVSKVLLDGGAAVNIPDEDSRSPLWWAVWKQHAELAELLTTHGADATQADVHGISPQGLLAGRAHVARCGIVPSIMTWE